MKPVTKPLSSLTPTDAVSTAALKAREDDDKIEPISFSLPKKHIRIVRQHAIKLAQEKDENVNASAALRDIIERAQL